MEVSSHFDILLYGVSSVEHPLKVKVSISVRSFGTISEKDMVSALS